MGVIQRESPDDGLPGELERRSQALAERVYEVLAEQLASPGLVLPWILGAVGAPAALVGLLVPTRRGERVASWGFGPPQEDSWHSWLPVRFVSGCPRRIP